MEENWAHHRPITILRERTQNKQEEPLTTKIPDIESKDKCDRDQVRIFLNNQAVLFKLILFNLNVVLYKPIFGENLTLPGPSRRNLYVMERAK